MSGEMRELIEVMLALSPWIAFVVAVIWSTVYRFISDPSGEELRERPPERAAGVEPASRRR